MSVNIHKFVVRVAHLDDLVVLGSITAGGEPAHRHRLAPLGAHYPYRPTVADMPRETEASKLRSRLG